MWMTFSDYNRAVIYAHEKAKKTGWYYSIIQRVNPHLRDYEFQVIPHSFGEAIYIAAPDGSNAARK